MLGSTWIVTLLVAGLSPAWAHRRAHDVDVDSWDFDFSFTGIETYAHLPHVKCLTNPDEAFDIGIVGAPLYCRLH